MLKCMIRKGFLWNTQGRKRNYLRVGSQHADAHIVSYFKSECSIKFSKSLFYQEIAIFNIRLQNYEDQIEVNIWPKPSKTTWFLLTSCDESFSNTSWTSSLIKKIFRISEPWIEVPFTCIDDSWLNFQILSFLIHPCVSLQNIPSHFQIEGKLQELQLLSI